MRRRVRPGPLRRTGARIHRARPLMVGAAPIGPYRRFKSGTYTPGVFSYCRCGQRFLSIVSHIGEALKGLSS